MTFVHFHSVILLRLSLSASGADAACRQQTTPSAELHWTPRRKTQLLIITLTYSAKKRKVFWMFDLT